MGCAPSIHVSQSAAGVVYCREDIKESSPSTNLHPVHVSKKLSATSLSISEVVSHIPVGHRESVTAEVRITRYQSGPHDSLITSTQAWVSTAEGKQTQTEYLSQGMEKASKYELQLGPMKVYKQPMEVLLVFGSDDAQSEAFITGIKRGGYRYKMQHTAESAMEYYLKKLPEEKVTSQDVDLKNQLVIIDLRSNSHFDGESLCRNIRSTRPNVNTVIIAITTKNESEDISVSALLKTGFNRRFVEDHNSIACLNELLMLDQGEVASQCKLRATSCLFSAVEHAYDAIEIQCVDPEKTEFQYVNPAYEKVTGYWRNEVVGNTKNNILSNCEVPKPPAYFAILMVVFHRQKMLSKDVDVKIQDSHENISKLLSTGKSWEGVCIARKKSGEQFVQNLKIVPIIGHAGRVTHYVVVKRDLTAVEKDTQIQQMHQELRKSQIDKETPNVVQNSVPVNISHSVSIKAEAPITKVINMLNAVQENSPQNVVQVLEKVIDILRTTELYTPSTFDQVEEKGIETDLVEGLMWNVNRKKKACFKTLTSKFRKKIPFKGVNVKVQFRERRHSADSNIKGLLHRDSSQGFSSLMSQKVFQVTQAPPEIQEALEGDDQWSYDIIKLERVSNKRPLYYLGQTIFNRFNIAAYLSIPDTVLRNWFQLIEANYHVHNTYHNSTHAADVLHATACFLMSDPVKEKGTSQDVDVKYQNVLERTDEVAALIAAVVHDVDHPGFTNSFLCNAGNDLAVLYNDIAVLESHHSAMAFKLTSRDPKSNIFQNLSQDEFKLLRQSIIDMVMATEMKQHFEHLAKFENNFNKRHMTHDETASANGRGTPESVTSAHVNFQSPENRAIVRRMIIKCADIANPARPTELCVEWAYRIAEEYFRQTEEEKKRNLPIVMPVFDRNTCNVPKSQIFFIDYFVMNLYGSWDKFAKVNQAMEYLRANYDYWNDEAEKLEKEKEKETSTNNATS